MQIGKGSNHRRSLTSSVVIQEPNPIVVVAVTGEGNQRRAVETLVAARREENDDWPGPRPGQVKSGSGQIDPVSEAFMIRFR